MEEVAQVDRSLKKLLLLNLLEPAKQSHGFLVDNADPVARVLWAFPVGLPAWWHLTFHEVRCFLLTLVGEHFSTLENAANGRDTLVDVGEDFFYSCNLHEDEAFDRVTRVEMVLRNGNPVKRLRFVELLPRLANRTKDHCPLFDIESERFLANRGKLFELVDDSLTVESLHTSIDVSRKAEQSWRVLIRNLLDHSNEVSWIGTLWNRDHLG